MREDAACRCASHLSPGTGWQGHREAVVLALRDEVVAPATGPHARPAEVIRPRPASSDLGNRPLSSACSLALGPPPGPAEPEPKWPAFWPVTPEFSTENEFALWAPDRENSPSMPLPGGPADKLGNRYENWWTVWQLVRMLHGACESIRIEDPGVDKAEFFLAVGGVSEWHQAKRSHPAGQWTLATLAGADIELLQAIGGFLDGNADRFVFVSASDARELGELADRARQAATPEEFETVFLAAQKYKDQFARLRNAWNNCDFATAYDRLRRIEVRTADERTIRELSRAGIAAVYLGSSDDLVAELRTIAEDSVHLTITREQLTVTLAVRGFLMRRAVHPDSALVLVENVTRRYLESVRGKLIRRTLVPRSETQTLLGILGDSARDIALTGKAGGGKTGCAIEFVDALRSRGVPVLALRLDRIDPASTAEELGRKAGLEESPALVLAAAAQGRREAVLVIDQLDAISTASGRSTGFFDAIESILTETRGLRERVNIHVVVVCREFDWENDHRLRKLLTKEHGRVSVDVFPVERVQEILKASGFDPTLFAPRQLELLRLPQNLSLFLDARFDPGKAPVFNTSAELFDCYWTTKRRAVRERAGGTADHWMDVIGLLVEEITRTQQLSVPRETLDAIDPEYLDQMSSEGVLTFDGRRHGFGHESFFDYCFARTFLARQRTLLDLLTSDEQHLFRRSQVRQVLAYLRDAHRSRYIKEVSAILTDARVRPHIKDLAFALIGSVCDPGEDEWVIWEPLIQPMLAAIGAGDPKVADKIATLGWQHFSRSPSWFGFAVNEGLVAEWLASDDPRANMAVDLLRIHERHSADVVAGLVEPYADSGGRWPARLRFLVEWSGHTVSRRFFDLTLRLIDNGALDEARGPVAMNSTFWSIFYDLGKKRPLWVPEVIASWVRRRITVLVAKGENLGRSGIFGHDQFAEEPIADAAKSAPLEFVQHVLPVILDLSERAVHKDAVRPKTDAVWPALIKSDHMGADGACLAGLDTALATLARDGHNLDPVIEDLRRRDTYIANHLLQVLYTAGADRYADEAAEMLVAEPWRFECGYVDSRHWTSTELVRMIAPRCGADIGAKLEAAIMAYASPWEHTEHGSFSILCAFPSNLRSSSGTKRLGEYERKFGKPAKAPRAIKMRAVPSPIEKDAADKMTDEQWLRAIEKYRSEHRLGDPLRGGALQLAQTLEALVVRLPERFAKLALRLPQDAAALYLDRILAGLKKSTLTNELKLAVCRKAFVDAYEVCGQSIVDVLGASEDTLPNDAVDILAWLATEHPDPDHEAWQTNAEGGGTYYNGDIYTNGINTTRGRAAEAICDLIWRDPGYVPRFRGALERMASDPSTCVRSCVAGALRAVARHDAGFALALFGRMAADRDERLLATVHVYDLIRLLLSVHFDDLRPTVERMLRSDHAAVARAGARLAGIAALYHEGAGDLEREAAAGTLPQRRGLAAVAAANIASDEHRSWCEGRLATFFNDMDEEVRKEAASCFRHLKDESLESYGPLVIAFIESGAYPDDSMSILQVLEKSIRRLPGITCVVCERFLDRFSDEARDMRTSRMADARTVAKLVFRTYHQHQQDQWTCLALDLIDRLCLEGIGNARKELDAFER